MQFLIYDTKSKELLSIYSFRYFWVKTFIVYWQIRTLCMHFLSKQTIIKLIIKNRATGFHIWNLWNSHLFHVTKWKVSKSDIYRDETYLLRLPRSSISTYFMKNIHVYIEYNLKLLSFSDWCKINLVKRNYIKEIVMYIHICLQCLLACIRHAPKTMIIITRLLKSNSCQKWEDKLQGDMW